jgi:LysM repeat protein
MGKFFIFLALFIFLIFLATAIPETNEPAQTVAAAQSQQGDQPQAQGVAGPCGTSFTVRAGDTMSEIAQLCGVSLASLIAANPGIPNPALIHPGQVVQIPSAPGIPVTGPGQYVVRSGDRLFRIALRFGTTVDAILAVPENDFITDPDRIFPGQVITLPPGIPVTGPGTNYTVRSGDTLFRISRAFGTTVNAILAANPWIANPNLIYPGWVIVVPAG